MSVNDNTGFDQTVLSLLQADLEKRNLNESMSSYLMALISSAKKEIQREGITLAESGFEEAHTVSMYAAYLYRKRALSENAMPRMLRYRLNQMIFEQHMKGDA